MLGLFQAFTPKFVKSMPM